MYEVNLKIPALKKSDAVYAWDICCSLSPEHCRKW